MKKQAKKKSGKSIPQRRKNPKYFYLILLLIPFVFIIIIEGSLRIFNYGKDLLQWIDAGNNKLTLNYNIA